MCGLVGYGSSDNEEQGGSTRISEAHGAAVRNISSYLGSANRPDPRLQPYHVEAILKHYGPMVSTLIDRSSSHLIIDRI